MPPPKRKRSDEQEAALAKELGTEPNAIQARDNDVLFGRGDCINRHPGNKRFRELVDAHKKTYLASRFKQEKRMIADTIISTIKELNPPGRFLAKDASGQWEMVKEHRAREKALQALREKARSVRAQVDAREPPRQSLPPEPWGLPAFLQINPTPVQPEMLASRGLPTTQITPSLGAFTAGSRPPIAQPNAAHIALSMGLSAAQPIPAMAALTAAFSAAQPNAANIALSAGLRYPAQQRMPSQPPNAGVASSYLNTFTAPAAAGYTITPAPSADSQGNIPVASSPPRSATLAATSIGAPADNLRSPESQSSSIIAPMALPPPLPNDCRTFGKRKIQPLSSRLMSPRPSPTRVYGPVMPPPADRRLTIDTSTMALASLTGTPRRSPLQNAPRYSPLATGTFDALQKFAFPESPGLDQMLTSPTHPFSPRRLPPNRTLGMLQSATATMSTNLMDQLNTAPTTLSPQVQAPSRHRRLTPRHLEPSDSDPQLTAQQVAYQMPMLSSTGDVNPSLAPVPNPLRQAQAQQQQESQSPLAYSPLPMNPQQQLPTPPLDSPFGRRLDMLSFLEHPLATIPSPRREIPLPRANLARRSRREEDRHSPNPN